MRLHIRLLPQILNNVRKLFKLNMISKSRLCPSAWSAFLIYLSNCLSTERPKDKQQQEDNGMRCYQEALQHIGKG